MNKKLEAIFWSIALPGFAQILQGHLLKGALLVGLEIGINILANFNEVIVLSFSGQILQAIERTDYSWLMFYPCLYFFAMWDAYKSAGGGEKPFSYLPFAFSAYFVTVGLIFSPTFTISGSLIGPVWLPMSFVIIGLLVGWLLQYILIKVQYRKES